MSESGVTRKLPAWFERVSAGAVAASLIEFTVSTMPLSTTERLMCDVAAIALRAFFAVEFLARLATAESTLRYVGSIVGLLDLGAVVLDVGSLKMLRLLKLAARRGAFTRLRRAVAAVRQELSAAGACAGALIYRAAVMLHYAERNVQPDAFGSTPAALWWSVITLTTIGYGDVSPITPVGRAITAVVALLGLGMVAIPTGLIASALMTTKEE